MNIGALVYPNMDQMGLTGPFVLDSISQGFPTPKSTLRDTDYGTREFGIVDHHGALVTFL